MVDGVWTAFNGEQPVAFFYDHAEALAAMALVQTKLAA